MGTNRDHRNMMKTGFGVLFLLVVLQTGTHAQSCPQAPILARINENNEVGAVVTTIPDVTGAILEIITSLVPFRIQGDQLLVTQVLDYEKETTFEVDIRCTLSGQSPVRFQVIVLLQNLNDNIPTFAQELYTLSVAELTPVDTLVKTFTATDLDNLEPLIYTLTSTPDVFKLKSRTDPGIVVAKPLDFDSIKSVQLILTVQDTDPATPTHTDTTTIDVTITDTDNRPPWFQPCTPQIIQGVKICPHTGYRGEVTLGEMTVGPIPLEGHNIWATDGDTGINEPSRYYFVGASEFFDIGLETGNITMKKAVDVPGAIQMTVMATQALNAHQFATTSLTVLAKSLHAPQFEKTLYEAMVKGVGTLALDAADNNKVLQILAKDEDYAADNGINPFIVYTMTGSNSTAFTLMNGFLYMFTEVPEGFYDLEVMAKDINTSETATTQLRVEVVPEPTTTVPPTTISTTPTEPTSNPTTPDQTSNPTTAATTNAVTSPTSNPTPTPSESTKTTIITPGVSVQTSNPVTTTGGITGSTAGVIKPSGDFRSADMAALGASLGCLLFLSIIVIAILVVKLRKGNVAWKKINEASAFRSSLGPSGQKEGVQFTNEAFEHDDDDKDNKGPSGGGLETDKPQPRSLPRPPSPIQDEEKEVKPILTKDKFKEDGYKAVWFKEDIDPNAKEEVVIIPDRGEEEEEDEDEGESKRSKVMFNDADVDSGLGDKNEDSEEEKTLTSSL
ncbi:cadherin-related family member 5-like [Boleophthalmus pectinirostris]|uniref:cadherin-related family member 5-like n=1 Tax=Boleophthalmus pectinirostris TaxID=150288 RepID=UPI0024325E0C|nr:cadherin-related family member 5-like [Boleophthalmus pectinirostris]